VLSQINGESRKGAEDDDVSAPSSFIANARIKLYAFYTIKGGFLKIDEATPSPILLESVTKPNGIWALVVRNGYALMYCCQQLKSFVRQSLRMAVAWRRCYDRD